MRSPRGTLFVVTADHGMVDVPADAWTDLAEEAALAEEVSPWPVIRGDAICTCVVGLEIV